MGGGDDAMPSAALEYRPSSSQSAAADAQRAEADAVGGDASRGRHRIVGGGPRARRVRRRPLPRPPRPRRPQALVRPRDAVDARRRAQRAARHERRHRARPGRRDRRLPGRPARGSAGSSRRRRPDGTRYCARPGSRPSSDARVTAAGPNRSRTASSAASTERASASSSTGSVSWSGSPSPSRLATVMPSRVRPRSRTAGRGLLQQGARDGQDRRTTRTCCGASCASASRWRSRRSAGAAPPCGRRRPFARIRRVTRSTSPTSTESSASGLRGRRPRADWAPNVRRRLPARTRTGVAVVGQVVELAAGGRAERSRRARPRPSPRPGPRG